MDDSVLIRADDVVKVYRSGQKEYMALNKVSFDIGRGEFVVILGPSGAGKTTLLNLLGGMDTLTEGRLYSCDVVLDSLKDRELTKYRRDKIGFVFQFYNLMPNLTALENVELAVELKQDHLDCVQVLDKVGLKDKMHNFPSQLSGGEQQRVSIARAVAKNPDLLLCDEPTGALDYDTGKKILGLLYDICKSEGKTVVVVTHNSALKDMADKVFYIKNGKITKEERNMLPKSIEDIEW